MQSRSKGDKDEAGRHLGVAMGRDPEQLSDWLSGRCYPFRRNREKIERFLDGQELMKHC